MCNFLWQRILYHSAYSCFKFQVPIFDSPWFMDFLNIHFVLFYFIFFLKLSLVPNLPNASQQSSQDVLRNVIYIFTKERN